MFESLSPETSQTPELLADIVVLGKIVDAYGLRGAVKLHLFADDPSAWASMPYWWLGNESDPPQQWRKVKLDKCRVQSGFLVATLDGVPPDRNAAELMRGLLVGAPRSAFPATRVGEYYWADLVGLEVVNVQGQCLGKVLGLIETAANDVLRVGGSESKERLLPFVAAVVLEVDLSARRMCVDWGLDW